jgi:hypothetical protein
MFRIFVLLSALLLVGADFKPKTPLAMRTPYVPMRSVVNIINIPHGQFTFFFTTTDNRLIPAQVDGLQYGSDRHNNNWQPTPGLKRTMEINTHIVFYVSTKFNTYCDLDKLIVIGDTGYRMEIDLDVFWGGHHKFGPRESYAMCMYL